jgi:hypothetical protein
LNQKYKLVFGNKLEKLELRIKKKNIKNDDMTRFEPTTFCLIDKHVTSVTNAFTGKHAAARRCYYKRWCSVNFVLRKKKKIRGENGGIFGWGFVIWIPAGTKHVLSADRLFLYVRYSCSWRFYTVSRLSLMSWGK